MMKRAALLTVIALIVSACGAAATATPTAFSTPTITRTATVSSVELTAAATFRATLPATFTATFTPSASPTLTATRTPSITPSPTTVPEDVLCESFVIQVLEAPVDGVYRGRPVLLETFTPYDIVQIYFELYQDDADEPFFSGELDGGATGLIQILLEDLPESGEYHWQATLRDGGREGLCPIESIFRADLTAEVTPEMTEEPDVEVTLEVTEESDVEVTPEVTSEP